MQTPHPLVGTKYQDWKKLEKLPRLTCQDHNPPLEVGELFVVIDSGGYSQLPNGSIVQLKRDDRSDCPDCYGSTDAYGWCYYKTEQLARLPKGYTGEEIKKLEKNPAYTLFAEIDGVDYNKEQLESKLEETTNERNKLNKFLRVYRDAMKKLK